MNNQELRSRFAFSAGYLRGLMSKMEEQNDMNPNIPPEEWEELKVALRKVSARFYEDHQKNDATRI